MVPIIVAEMVPPEQYGKYNGIISLSIALSFLAGPLIGGAIPDHATWRWIFWINIPFGLVGLVLISISMPRNFPDLTLARSMASLHNLHKLASSIDFLGFFLMLTTCVLLIVALEEAGISLGWSSPIVITFLALAFILFCIFIAWQWILSSQTRSRQPVMPWQLLRHRVLMGLYL